jgi:hypothetical protein
MNLHRWKLAVVLIGLAGTLGCEKLEGRNEAPPRMDPTKEVSPVERFEASLSTAPNLLARVRLGSERALEIFEMQEGALGYSEVGTSRQLGQASPLNTLTDDDYSDPVKVVQKLAPGEAIPARLQEYAARKAAPVGQPGRGKIKVAAGKSEASAPFRGKLDVTRSGGTAASTQAKEVEVVAQGLTNTDSHGNVGNNCPFSFFQAVSGPLGQFCPSSGNVRWCEANVIGGEVLTFDALPHRTKDSLATMCVDANGPNGELPQMRVMLGNPPASAGPAFEQSFFQPAGTFRQWKSTMGCRCDCCGSCCLFCGRLCDNWSVKYEFWSHGGNLQSGGNWNPW